MADSPISGLAETTTVGDNDLLLLEQNSAPRKIAGRNWKQYFNANVVSASVASVTEPNVNPSASFNQYTHNLSLSLPSADYIDTVELTSSAGLVDTYTITSKLGHTGTFTVTNGMGGSPSDADPQMDGSKTAGVQSTYSRSDHVHPTDTSRAAASDLTTLSGTVSGLGTSKADKSDFKAFTVTLTTTWTNSAQTVSNANFLASGYAYIVSPASDNFTAYAEAGIYADNVTTDGSMTFHCTDAPSGQLVVNIVRTVSA